MKNCIYLLMLTFISISVCAQEFKVGFEARDKRTKRSLAAIISVRATNSERELAGQMRDDLYVINVQPNTEYQVIVACQDYNTFRQTLNFEKVGSSTETQPFLVSLVSIKDQPLAEKVTPVVEQPIVEPVIATKVPEVKTVPVAKIEKVAAVIQKPAPVIPEVVVATPVLVKNEVKQNLSFKVIDATTGQPIAAKFKLTDNIKDTYSGSTNNDDNFYEVMVLVQPEPYQLLITAVGYRNYQEKISLTKQLSNEQSKKIIKLSKSDVFLKINVLDEQTVSALKVATVRVIDVADKRAAVNVRDVPNGQVVAQIQPERKYIVEVESAGYVPFSKSLDEVLTKLNAQNTINVKLKKFTESYIAISAINASTGQRVPARFKLKGEQNDEIIELNTTAGALVAKMKVTDPDIYRVETIASGFKTSVSNLDAEEIVPGQDLNFEAKLTPGVTTTIAPTTAPKPIPVSVSFNFLVVDASTNNAVANSKFKVINQQTKQPVSTIRAISNGFQASLIADNFYIVEVEANGYDKSQLKFESVSGGRSEFQISLNAAKKIAPIVRRTPKPVVNERIFDNIKIGQSVAIEDNVYFDQSSYVLRYEAYPQLARLAGIMLRNPKMSVGIIGHTDNVGDPRLNLILSENRSKVISNFLVNKGVAENRILHTGEGQTRPLANNETEENRKRNRRVEFIIK